MIYNLIFIYFSFILKCPLSSLIRVFSLQIFLLNFKHLNIFRVGVAFFQRFSFIHFILLRLILLIFFTQIFLYKFFSFIELFGICKPEENNSNDEDHNQHKIDTVRPTDCHIFVLYKI